MKEELKKRMFRFAVDCGKLCATFPKSREYNAYCNQLIRSSSSVGANYRAACRAKSDRDFIYKLKIVEEEADESMLWLDVLKEMKGIENAKMKRLYKEANELISIAVASIITVRKRLKNK
ncbi:four helix bundle protein [Cochleicola gelatinilyticus]|uniref:Four helix bundle protein n=1 Tax=Cochleicola gelatinilyticus TaxID=1763537 RepID=A0A167F0G4_9FLAO|nr:four helix bundle protein [Cochleicola gelatinilyticus]OAB76061.1 four helix bundle protein [Cochleicola gelatinilyticus]